MKFNRRDRVFIFSTLGLLAIFALALCWQYVWPYVVGTLFIMVGTLGIAADWIQGHWFLVTLAIVIYLLNGIRKAILKVVSK